MPAGAGQLFPFDTGQTTGHKNWLPYQPKRPMKNRFGNGFAAARKISLSFWGRYPRFMLPGLDKIESYRQWAAQHPHLAKTLPIDRTGRGMHVYFRYGHC
jgi:hypothetical protein